VVVGLVGCGRWGRHILRDLVALGCEVHVVARSEESRLPLENDVIPYRL
jgi:Trk K+ transport system NAD-binding subunit